jgi:hypothetical protein
VTTMDAKKKKLRKAQVVLTEKICKQCKNTLPIERFAYSYYSHDGHLHTCKNCIGENAREARQRNKGLVAPDAIVEAANLALVRTGTGVPKRKHTVSGINSGMVRLRAVVRELEAEGITLVGLKREAGQTSFTFEITEIV